jgi:hypothetical protein
VLPPRLTVGLFVVAAHREEGCDTTPFCRLECGPSTPVAWLEATRRTTGRREASG